MKAKDNNTPKGQHTQGKWIIDHPNFEELTICTEQVDICTVYREGEFKEQGEANAKLISCAPELLDRLRAALGVIPYGEEALAKSIVDVIKKATE